jgi:serine/threonine protein kinase
MGLVVQATHVQLGTPVAIKLLRHEALEEPAMVERFLREARSAARLRGEHVCRVTDFGTTESGVPFMVMEYLEGTDLASMIDDHGVLEVEKVATYISQACIGVAEAHALGIIHRDLKPGNLFLTRGPDGRDIIKLLDFGIAKATQGGVDPSLTQTQKAMGSPAYMSPEQLRAHSTIDTRSDVWALGVTMFELLTENRPFEGDTPYELALAINNDPAAKLPDTVAPEMAKIVMKCLEKDREKRYANVAELAAALAPLAKHGKDLAASVRAALEPNAPKPRASALREGDAATETTMRGASGTIDPEAPPRKRSRLAIPLALLAAGGIAAAAFFMWPRGEDAPSVTPAATTTPPPPQPQAPPPEPPKPEPAPVVTPDAAIAEPVTVPPDAAVVTKPEKPAKPVKPKKRPRNPSTSDPDFGKSRF